MAKPLGYGRVYWNDLMGECMAQDFGLRDRSAIAADHCRPTAAAPILSQ